MTVAYWVEDLTAGVSGHWRGWIAGVIPPRDAGNIFFSAAAEPAAFDYSPGTVELRTNAVDIGKVVNDSLRRLCADSARTFFDDVGMHLNPTDDCDLPTIVQEK